MSNQHDIARAVTRRIVRRFIDAGLAITVTPVGCDEDEVTRAKTTDEVMRAINATGWDCLTIFEGSKAIGTVSLMHGEGRHVLSDYSDGLADFLEGITDWAETLK